MRLSVLDQTPISAGSSAGDALRNSIDLAVRTEALGYHRYWVAEHHNTLGLAGSAPEILVGHGPRCEGCNLHPLFCVCA